MEIYYALALTAISLNFLINNHKILSLILTFFMVLIAAFRFNVGTDYESYVEIIKNIDNQNSDRGIEYTFTILVKLIQNFSINNPEYIVISVYALLTGFIILILIKKLNYSPNFIYTYIFLSPFYLQSFNLIRLYVAVPIIWYVFLEKPRFFLYVLLVILATSFHYSAIILLVFYPFLFFNIRIEFKILTIPIIIFSQLFISKIIPDYYNFYISKDNINYNYNFLLILLFGWIYTEMHRLNVEYLFIRNLSFFALLSAIISIFLNIQPELIYRYSLYFSIYIPLIMSVATIDYSLESLIKKITCRIILPILFLFSLHQTGLFYKLVPYQTFI